MKKNKRPIIRVDIVHEATQLQAELFKITRQIEWYVAEKEKMLKELAELERRWEENTGERMDF